MTLEETKTGHWWAEVIRKNPQHAEMQHDCFTHSMSKLPSPNIFRRIDNTVAVLIATAGLNQTNVQVSDYPGDGSLAA